MPVNKLLRRSKKIFKISFFLIIFSFISLLIGIFLNKNNFLTINHLKIVCKNCQRENILGLSLIENKNIFYLFFKKKDIEKKILLANFDIKEVVLEIKPFMVTLQIEAYQPEACLYQNGFCFLLSEDGRILKKNKQILIDFPKIIYYQNLADFYYKAGSWVDYNDIKFTLLIIKFLRNLNFEPKKVEIKSEEMIIVKIDDNKEIFFSSKKDIEKQKYELTQVLKQFKIKGRDFRRLDLRFNKPVVIFN